MAKFEIGDLVVVNPNSTPKTYVGSYYTHKFTDRDAWYGVVISRLPGCRVDEFDGSKVYEEYEVEFEGQDTGRMNTQIVKAGHMRPMTELERLIYG